MTYLQQIILHQGLGTNSWREKKEKQKEDDDDDEDDDSVDGGGQVL